MLKILTLFVFTAMVCTLLNSQVYTGSKANSLLQGAQKIKINSINGNIEYFEFSPNYLKSASIDASMLAQKSALPQPYTLQSIKESIDQQGDRHHKFQLYYKDILVEGMGYSVHYQGKIPKSVNGIIIKGTGYETKPTLSEYQAIGRAVSLFSGQQFYWDKDKSLYPTAELLYVPVDSILTLCYKIDVYVLKPLQREYVYINALSGDVVKRISRINNKDQVGTATTQYNGVVQLMADYNSGLYTLSEISRGNGIHTFNLNNGVSYGNASEFYDDDNNWDSTDDMSAYDAHYGSEKTYDYYFSKFGRNSIDGNGFALNSYIHFDYNYANAFWDGERMTYGDGDGNTMSPLTCMDIVAHEITHGLTSHTANLEYSDESGALNESFSDIFGVAIDFYANPSTANYLIGEQVFMNGQGAIRSMEDPNSMGDPDTYQGNYWITGSSDNGGVHTNSSVQNYWFYLLCEGGVGVNDKGDSYAVNAIGIEAAEAIAYRNLTVYLTQYSNYNDARFYSIQSAIDLFGNCSQEVIEVTNAWYAVGVGEPFSNAVISSFVADQTYFCSAPGTVNFTSTSTHASAYKWFVNDAFVSAEDNPALSFDQVGDYTIKLVVTGSSGCNSTDTTELENYITVSDIGTPLAPLYTPASQYGGLGGIYSFNFAGINKQSKGAEDGYVDYACESRANVMEGKEYEVTIRTGNSYEEAVNIWIDLNNDGEFSNTTEKVYSCTSMSQHTGSFIIPAGQVYDTPLRLRIGSDRLEYVSTLNGQSNSYYGQYEDYTVIIEGNTNAPEANFALSDSVIGVNETISFVDKSLNIPTQWNWSFVGGDPLNSNVKNPTVTYNAEGVYGVELTATNSYGSSSYSGNIHVINAYLLGTHTESSSESGSLFDSGGKAENYSNSENYSFLISPPCAREVVLTFQEFSTEGCCDNLFIYDGTSANDPLLSNLKGDVGLPVELRATSGSMFLVFVSDGSVTSSGFEAQWAITEYGDGNAVVADFAETDGNIPLNFNYPFIDNSLNEPMIWSWDFGNGVKSSEQNPVNRYLSSGVYNVELAVDNCFSKDTVIKQLTVDTDPEMQVNNDTIVIHVMSGDSVAGFIPVDNLSGGVLAFEGNLIATYKKDNTFKNKNFDTQLIYGYHHSLTKSNFVVADVPAFDDNEKPNQISVIQRNYQVTEQLQGVNVGVGGSLTGYYDFLNFLTANGAKYTVVPSIVEQSMLDTVDVLILDDDCSSQLMNYKEQIQTWVNNRGFLLIQGDENTSGFNGVLEGSGISYVRGDINSGGGSLFDHPVTSTIAEYYISSGALSKLDVISPAIPIINNPDAYTYCAVSEMGRGKVMAITNEAFGNITYLGHEELLINAVKWGVSSANGNWITVEGGYRFVDVHESDSVKYQIGSRGLLEGIYIGDVQITSNDQNTEIIDVPIQLNVTGIENIESNVNSLWFPKVFVNETDSVNFILRNTGTRDLEITNIASTIAELSVVNTPVVLTPGESYRVQVVFAPVVNQLYNGAIEIHSSDPDMPVLTVSVSGNAVNPPRMEVNNEVIQDLFTDESAETTLIISNVNGESALAIDSILIGGFSSSFGILSDTLQFDLSGHSIATPWVELYYFNDLMIKNGAQVSANSLDTMNMADVLWIDRNFGYSINENEIDFVERWVKDGGGLFIDAYSLNSSYNLYKLMLKLGIETVNNNAYNAQYEKSNHIVMDRINPTDIIGSVYDRILSENGTPLLYDNDGNVYAKALNHGYGRVVVTTFSSFYNFNNSGFKLFAMNSMRWLANKNSWLWVSDYPVDSIQAGEETELNLMFDASNRPAGTYQAQIRISSNDPVTSSATVQATLNVSGVPKQAFANDTLRFNEQFIGYSQTDSVMVYNPGTSNLEISNIYCTNNDYSFSLANLTLDPRQTRWLYITYDPVAVESDNAFLVFDNNTSAQKDTVVLTGWAVEPPVISVSPTEINLALRPGETVTEQITIDNSLGGSLLNYSIGIEHNGVLSGSSELQIVLDSLNNNYASITELIPNKYSFSSGVSGSYISDGGEDMYDSGNYLGTDLNPRIYYSDNQIITSSAFGVNGQYFTRKYDGLFVLAADVNKVSTFSITGGLGADGSGYADTTVLSVEIGSKRFDGYVKRVYDAGDPSVNHLVIVEHNSDSYQSCSLNTDSDDQAIYNLNNSTRIYYLLYAGSQGAYINNESTLAIMQAFLNMVEGNVSWIVPEKFSGSIDGGSFETLNMLVDASELEEGSYVANVQFESNDPNTSYADAVVNLTVRNNFAPTLDNPIENQVIYLTYDGEINLNEVFSDQDNDQIFYQVSSSDNSMVFPVLNNGSILKLKPLVEGVATINIEATDNNFTPIYYSFDVLVQANNSPVVENQLEDVWLQVNEVTRVIDLNNYFSDADDDQLNYTSSVTTNGVVKNENGGNLLLLSAINDGTTIVTVVANDGKGASVSGSFIASVVGVSTDMDDVEFEGGLYIYPNPVTKYLNIQSESGVIIEQVKIVDLNGREVLFDSNILNGVMQIDASYFDAGFYFVIVKTNLNEVVQKILKK